MKFVFLSPVAWNFYPLQNQNLAIALAQNGHEVNYIEPVKYKNYKNNRFAHLSKNLKPQGLTVTERSLNIPKSFLVFLYENVNNTRKIIRYKPDVVVCYDHLMGLLSCLYCFFAKTKFVYNASDDWDNVPQDISARIVWKILIKPLITRFSYAIAAISHKQFEAFRKKKKKTFLLPNGVSNNFISKAEGIDASNTNNTVNFIANLRDWYDFDLLFDVFKEFPTLQLNIYGSGSLFNELKKKSALYSNIKLMGNIEHELSVKLLKESLFGIIPLKKNILNDSTCPIKLFDYWAAQKVVIATPTYEMNAIGKDCILFASSKETWVKHIRYVLYYTKLAKILERVGHEKIINTYNYNYIYQHFINNI